MHLEYTLEKKCPPWFDSGIFRLSRSDQRHVCRHQSKK